MMIWMRLYIRKRARIKNKKRFGPDRHGILARFLNLLLLFSSLFGSEEILVHLDSQAPLFPLFLSAIDDKESDFPKAHLTTLRETLAFDLNYNGSTKVLLPSEVAKKRSLKGKENASWNCEALADDGICYLVQLIARKDQIKIEAINTHTQKVRTIEAVLTKDMTQDRRTMHAVADAIHEFFFGTPGIASCKILFTIKTGTVSEVYEADYDGKNQVQITQENALCTHPLYLPGPARPGAFSFVSYRIGQPKMYYASLKGGTIRRSSFLRGNQLTPSFSSDGSMIAFASDFTGTSDIFIQPFRKEVGPIGKPCHVFAAKGATQASPVFSPDGKKIAFVSNKDGSPKIYVINTPAPGTKLKEIKAELITKLCGENSAPAWSPDGKKLAYSAKTGGPRQIWIYDFETGREQEITQGPKNKENPAWAPNSLHLLYNAQDVGSSELYLINIRQLQPIQITSGKGEKFFPSWEPAKCGITNYTHRE